MPLVHRGALEGDLAEQAAALEVPDPLRIDYGRASRSMNEAVAIAMKILTAPPAAPIGRDVSEPETDETDESDDSIESGEPSGDA